MEIIEVIDIVRERIRESCSDLQRNVSPVGSASREHIVGKRNAYLEILSLLSESTEKKIDYDETIKLGDKVFVKYLGDWDDEDEVVCLGKDAFVTKYMLDDEIKDDYKLPLLYKDYGKTWIFKKDLENEEE